MKKGAKEMPRLKPSEAEMQTRIVKTVITNGMTMRGIHGYEDLGKRLGMTTDQIKSRMTGRAPWALPEIWRVCRVLNLSMEEKMKLLPREAS